MEAPRIAATIRNPAEPDRFREGLFRVATGAADSLVPRRRLEANVLARALREGKALHERRPSAPPADAACARRATGGMMAAAANP